jgi:methylmalonyl-CoA mutase
LRDLSDAYLRSMGGRPKVYLAALGPESKHRRRVQFMREWLEVGGFEAVYDGETPTAEAALARVKESGAWLVCLCGSDDAYAEQAEAFAKAFKASGAKGVALAGRPGEFERAWRAAGVEEFIFAGRDAVETLQSFYRRIGVAPAASGIVTS